MTAPQSRIVSSCAAGDAERHNRALRPETLGRGSSLHHKPPYDLSPTGAS
jgi:hypothetical protein